MILVWNLLNDFRQGLCIGVWKSLLVFTVTSELALIKINVIATSKSEPH